MFEGVRASYMHLAAKRRGGRVGARAVGEVVERPAMVPLDHHTRTVVCPAICAPIGWSLVEPGAVHVVVRAYRAQAARTAVLILHPLMPVRPTLDPRADCVRCGTGTLARSSMSGTAAIGLQLRFAADARFDIALADKVQP